MSILARSILIAVLLNVRDSKCSCTHKYTYRNSKGWKNQTFLVKDSLWVCHFDSEDFHYFAHVLFFSNVLCLLPISGKGDSILPTKNCFKDIVYYEMMCIGTIYEEQIIK